MGSYVMYHCHTEDSLLDSCTRYQDYVDLAVRDGMKALSISEHGKPLQWTEKWNACTKAGIKYIHSVEIYLTESLEERVRDNYHTVLMARNMDGLRELNALVSRSCDEDHFYYTNRISFEEFLGISPNIISTSACLASPLNKLPASHPMYDRLAMKYDFLEIQPHDHPGRVLAQRWQKLHPNETANPWSLPNIARIKSEISSCDEASKKENRSIWEYEEFRKAEKKYPDLFYYFRGLVGTKISQSVHPAGMVISPITLNDNYGTFDKDGEICLMLDMENIHDFTGLAKYDFLILKTVQVIRDTCKYLGRPYPKSHEIDWNDPEVWEDMIKNPAGLFQFESKFAFDSLKKFKPHSLFDMSIVTACIRPSGQSYRDELLSRKVHKNPSEIIDELLSDNLGYLIYQEDTIKFLQQICGLSGSEADNIRRAIGRKQKDRLDKAMPSILEGYCTKSPEPREKAEEEAKEFLQIIEDSASYQFGYNHSIAYCMLGYLCAYFRHYHPLEFITSFLNNAANEDDIRNGTAYANKVGIKITMPKWGLSKGEYFFNTDERIIAKGLSSIKYMSSGIAEELFNLSREKLYSHFVDVLLELPKTSVDTRQLEILIKIDFFSAFGNQRELLRISDLFFETFKKGQAKQIQKAKIDGSPLGKIVEKYAVGVTKSGVSSKSYTILDMHSILAETEDAILSLGMDDLGDVLKVKNFADVMGYAGYVSGKEEDRRKLYVMDVYPLMRKRDGKQFGYSVVTKSIGSGIESRFTVLNKIYDALPINKGDIIYCTAYTREGEYFKLTGYSRVV